jgi:hypothetical protein
VLATGGDAARAHERTDPMWRLLRFLLILILLLAWSYSGFLQPDRQVVTEPVELGGE